MEVDSLLQRGFTHSNYNEDALFHKFLNEDWFVGAVMDGCSGGLQSYFTSALYGKSIQKSCLTIQHLDKVDDSFKLAQSNPGDLSRKILNHLFDDVQGVKRSFLLEVVEVLSTLILFVYNSSSKEACLAVSGDGFFSVNGEITEIDQNNMPDFMGYHLEKSFEEWFENHLTQYNFSNVEEACISTDGISKLLDDKKLKKENLKTEEILLGKSNQNYSTLKNIYTDLVTDHHLFPYDDIAMIKVRN